MKKSLIATAIMGMGLAAPAFAVGPGVTPDFTIYAGGGSAQANAIYVAASSLLNNMESYTDSATCGESGTWRILYGTAKTTFGPIAAGKNVLFMYRFGGGSFPNGIGAVGNATTLAYPTNAEIATAVTTSCAPAGGHPTYHFALTGSPSTVSQIPDWGVSDEEVALFNTPLNVPATYTSCSGLSCWTAGPTLSAAAISASGMQQAALYTNLMGMAIPLKMYQGSIPGFVGHPKTKFTKAELAGIMTGAITDWNQLYSDDNVQMPDQQVILLDRAPGSGTKAGNSLYLLSSPSVAVGGLVPLNEAPGGGGPFGTVPTTACSASNPAANVDVNEGSSTTLFQDLQSLNNNNCMAIGILGLEFAPEVEGGNYQFVSVNGVDPYARITSNGHTIATYANEINGTYDWFYDNSFQYRTKSVNGGHFLGDGSAGAALINPFKNALSSNSLPGGVSGVFPAGVTGTLLDPNIDGDVTCATTGSRFAKSASPLQIFIDPANVGPVPVCNDPLN